MYRAPYRQPVMMCCCLVPCVLLRSYNSRYVSAGAHPAAGKGAVAVVNGLLPKMLAMCAEHGTT